MDQTLSPSPQQPNTQPMIEQARMLIGRLERISADSIWARRSSGARGALLHWLENFDRSDSRLEPSLEELGLLAVLLDAGYSYLEHAARERIR